MLLCILEEIDNKYPTPKRHDDIVSQAEDGDCESRKVKLNNKIR